MALPDPVRVKLASEHAAAIALTPVVVENMAPRALAAVLLAVTGKDGGRVREILERGSFVAGATRYRWDPIRISLGEVERLLATFPDPEPGRAFDAPACVKVILHGPGVVLEVPRAIGARRRLFRRRSFWDAILRLGGAPLYATYSYREEADRFDLPLSPAQVAALRQAAELLAHRGLAHEIRRSNLASLTLFTRRGGGGCS